MLLKTCQNIVSVKLNFRQRRAIASSGSFSSIPPKPKPPSPPAPAGGAPSGCMIVEEIIALDKTVMPGSTCFSTKTIFIF